MSYRRKSPNYDLIPHMNINAPLPDLMQIIPFSSKDAKFRSVSVVGKHCQLDSETSPVTTNSNAQKTLKMDSSREEGDAYR